MTSVKSFEQFKMERVDNHINHDNLESGYSMSKHRILLIVDLQKEFADIDNNLYNYNKVMQFVKENGNKGSYDKIISTCFRNEENPNFRYNLNWYECEDSCQSSLEYIDYVDASINTVYVKQGYATEDSFLPRAINTFNESISEDAEIHIIGCDLDACIMAICFQLWDAGITNFKVLTEFCYTTAKDFTKEEVIKIMKRNFGKCIVED